MGKESNTWKEKGAHYIKPRTFQIQCSNYGKKDFVEMAVVDFGAKIQLGCTKCGASERV